MEPDEQTLREWWDSNFTGENADMRSVWSGAVNGTPWDELWDDVKEGIRAVFVSVLASQAKAIPDVSV
jgi:hypothetical protein